MTVSLLAPCRLVATLSAAAALASASFGPGGGSQTGDYTQYMQGTGFDYKQYMQGAGGDHEKYMKGGDDYKQYMRDNWMPEIHNTSDQQEWADAFKQKFANKWVPEVSNMSNQTEVSEAFKHRYADQWLPHVSNMSNHSEVSEAFKHWYADQWVPQVKNSSDQKDWSSAFKDSESHPAVAEQPAPVPVIALVATEAAESGETAEQRFERVDAEASETLQQLTDLEHQVSSVSVDEDAVREQMQASLTDADIDVFTVWINQSHEFDALHQRMQDEGANWSKAEMHDAVRQAEGLDERLRESESKVMGLVRKAGRTVADSIRHRVRSDSRQADDLARLGRRQSDTLEGLARDLHSRRREEAARGVDDRARSLERDVQEAADRLERHVEAHARHIEDGMRNGYRDASEKRAAELHQDRVAEAAMSTGSRAVSLASSDSIGSRGGGAGTAAVLAVAVLSLAVLARRRRSLAAVEVVDGAEHFLPA